MNITETLMFYLLVGVAVSVAMYLADNRRMKRTLFLLPTALLFWPLYLPLLLSSAGNCFPAAERQQTSKTDEMAVAIAQVELELQTALASLNGWPETALAREKERIGELRTALTTQAARIREIDELLFCHVTIANSSEESSKPADTLNAAAHDRWKKSRLAREQNFTRLAAIRRQSHADLMATLAWIRELVSMIHLAKFTGAPFSRTEELVAQIAAAVEGVSRVREQDEIVATDNSANVFAIQQ